MKNKIIYVSDELNEFIKGTAKSSGRPIKQVLNDLIARGLDKYEEIEIKNGEIGIGFKLYPDIEDKVDKLKESTDSSYNVILQRLILCGKNDTNNTES